MTPPRKDTNPLPQVSPQQKAAPHLQRRLLMEYSKSSKGSYSRTQHPRRAPLTYLNDGGGGGGAELVFFVRPKKSL